MSNDAEIVLIQRPQQDQAIQDLIATRQGYSLEQLAAFSPAQIDEVLRQFYLQAADKKLIRLINLWVRSLVGAPNGGIWEFRSVAITGDVPTIVRYDGTSGTTRATVGGLLVLSNEIPGREVLRPGNWILQLRDAYVQHQASARHEFEVAENRQAEAKVLDFLADV